MPAYRRREDRQSHARWLRKMKFQGKLLTPKHKDYAKVQRAKILQIGTHHRLP
jgi:hypothetical protein